MLVLSRRPGEEVVLTLADPQGKHLATVRYLEARGGLIRLGITAGPEVVIVRGEIYEKPQGEAGPDA